ncbi:ABC transporter ATP-binding protein [Clostridium massiliamazoniense]|uniref:ABC transporter ATP-binding protein n=1 Tax=Clostridium massiliamazoniense TaxID=1347366 RepID=UPI0006D8241B|nr:ABC transporter ATP-binding protein [Clostridium massiliamazoniense]
MDAIKISNLRKEYGNFLAVKDLSLSINEGDIFGLLGPNGAGKSTTISIICGILKATSGVVEIFNKDLNKNKKLISKEIGLVPQSIALYENYSAYENVKFFASLYGLKGKKLEEAITRSLEFTGLLEFKDKRAGEFSGGMMRRLNIACAIAHSPKLIIMDEPTVGIDPQSRNHILEFVKKLNEGGATIIYTTHYMEEVEALCNNIAIIDHGEIIAKGSPKELKEGLRDYKVLNIIVENNDNINMEQLKVIEEVIDVEIEGNLLSIKIEKHSKKLDNIIRIIGKDSNILDISFETVNLETVFLNLTGRKLRD